jgi:tetratricopeptide (TPR) repeat protein
LGRVVEALKAYKKVTDLNPSYAEGHNNLGVALHNEGKIDVAVKAYKKALCLRPDYTDAYFNMGKALKDQGKLDEAIRSYKKALAIPTGSHASVYYNMGNALKEQVKLQEALDAYKMSISLKSEHPLAYNNMGNVYKDQGKLEEALQAYNKALSLKPDYIDAHTNKGAILHEQGKREEAIAAYNKALSLKPDYADAYSKMGVTLQDQGKSEEAIEALTKSIFLKPDNAEAHLNMGNVLQDKGILKDAIKSYNKALSLKPDYADAYNNAGNALQDQGKLEEAIGAFKKALSLKPDYADAARNIVKLPVGLLDLETLEMCEKAIGFSDSKLKKTSEVLFFQANLLKHKGQIDQSFSKFREANKNKLIEIEGQVLISRSKHSKSLNRIKKWAPSFPKLKQRNLIKLFLLGPSRSGKSTLEQILTKSSHLYPFYESISLEALYSETRNDKNSDKTMFEGLFCQRESVLLRQNYEVITSTLPESVFYSDYLMDILSNTYFVIIKRNSHDLASEIFAYEYSKGNFHTYDPYEIEKYLSVYSKICDTLALKVPDRCITITFEEIIESPADTLEQIGQLVCKDFKISHLKQNIKIIESESLFRKHFAELAKMS